MDWIDDLIDWWSRVWDDFSDQLISVLVHLKSKLPKKIKFYQMKNNRYKREATHGKW